MHNQSTRRPSSPLDKAAAHEVAWQNVSDLFNATRGVGSVRFVYFIGEADDGPIKIGVSNDPIARLRTMQTGNPRRLRVEYVLVGDMSTEKLLHEMWGAFAVKSVRSASKPDAAPGTEWFTPEVRAHLLFPIVQVAAARQAARFAEGGTITIHETDEILRDAHAASGHVPHVTAPVRVLVADGGIATSRRSYL